MATWSFARSSMAIRDGDEFLKMAIHHNLSFVAIDELTNQ